MLTTSRPSSITRYPFASELSASVTLELSCIVKVSFPQRLFVIVALDFFLTSIVTSCDILHSKYIVLPAADALLPKWTSPVNDAVSSTYIFVPVTSFLRRIEAEAPSPTKLPLLTTVTSLTSILIAALALVLLLFVSVASMVAPL